MKNRAISTLRCYLTGSVLLIPFLLIGCASASTTRQLGSSIALRGQQVCESALTTYERLEDQQSIDKYQQDFIKVITSPSPTAPLPDTKPQDFGRQLEPRIKAYKSLKKAYAAFNELSTAGIGEEAETSTESLMNSLNSLRVIPDLPKGVADLIPKLASKISEEIQARKIRKHNLLLLQLVKAYEELWDEDLPVWKTYLRRIYLDYANGFTSLPAESFNESELDQAVEEPYAIPIKLRLYKLEKRKESDLKRMELEHQMNEVSQAFGLLVFSHTELAKEKPSISSVTTSLEWIGSILPTTDNERGEK